MNAPNNFTTEEFELYRQILPDNIIEETIARQKFINDNKGKSLEYIETVKCNSAGMAEGIDGVRKGLSEIADSFKDLEKQCVKNAEANDNMAAKMREFSETMRKTAQLIRSNLAR